MATRNLSGYVERILITLIIFSLVVFYFLTGNSELKKTAGYTCVLVLEIALAAYYIYLVRNVYSLFLAGFIVLNVGYLILGQPFSDVLIIAGLVNLFLLGIFLGYKTIRESIQNKDLELFGTLLTLGLIFPIIQFFYFPDNFDYLMVDQFALAFVLGTVMYNENLWDKYNLSEKKILTYVLVSTIVEVLLISVRFF
ncbi:MAG TPA: hypothetical protein VNB90_02060 [Cytophagaceae bacterium]|nr:hypothetical protein [Cytophagaceae bacterium]